MQPNNLPGKTRRMAVLSVGGEGSDGSEMHRLAGAADWTGRTLENAPRSLRQRATIRAADADAAWRRPCRTWSIWAGQTAARHVLPGRTPWSPGATRRNPFVEVRNSSHDRVLEITLSLEIAKFWTHKNPIIAMQRPMGLDHSTFGLL